MRSVLRVVLAQASSFEVALVGAIVARTLINACLGPVLSVYQVVAPRAMRAQLAAWHSMIAGVGLGAGPLLVGVLNE